jgi:CheY-like chemotaxis protein
MDYKVLKRWNVLIKDGNDAVEQIGTIQPDLIITDNDTV